MILCGLFLEERSRNMANPCNHEMSSFTGKCCFCGKTKRQIEGGK